MERVGVAVTSRRKRAVEVWKGKFTNGCDAKEIE